MAVLYISILQTDTTEMGMYKEKGGNKLKKEGDKVSVDTYIGSAGNTWTLTEGHR